MEARLELHDAHFESIEKKLEEHDEKFRNIFKHFDQVYQRFERLETEYYAISVAIDRIEKKLDGEISKREFLEKEVLDLKGKIQILYNRVEEIENQLKGVT